MAGELYDNEKEYAVTLALPVMYRRRKILPRDAHTMRGDMLNQIVADYGSEAIAAADTVSG